MIDTSVITGPWPAFIAGLVTSLHCAGMCGPLACYLAPSPGSRSSFTTVTSLYQAGRLVSYTLIGALSGGLGMVALGWVDIYQHSLSRFLPWILVVFFLLVALRADKYFPKPAFLTALLGKLQLAGSRSNRRVGWHGFSLLRDHFGATIDRLEFGVQLCDVGLDSS